MADNTVHQIISAYATGCLDKNNYIQFMNYMKGEGELPKGELGELQNVTALIPTLLELEEPSPELKNHVAKRILEVESVRKQKIKETAEKKQAPKVIVDESSIDGSGEDQTGKPEGVVPSESKPDADMAESSDDKPVKQGILPWILLGVIGLLLIVISVYFFITNGELKDEITDINTRLQGYQNEVVQTNKFINEHIELIEFLNLKNVEVVNFMPTDIKPDAYGKLFISLDAGEAILQLKNMPKITSRESFQLWLVNENQSFSLGDVFPSPGVEYYKINNLPSFDKKDIMMFRITKEIRGGSETPQGQLYLFGAFYNVQEDDNTSRRR